MYGYSNDIIYYLWLGRRQDNEENLHLNIKRLVCVRTIFIIVGCVLFPTCGQFPVNFEDVSVILPYIMNINYILSMKEYIRKCHLRRVPNSIDIWTCVSIYV